MQTELFSFTTQVACADADGVPIREGAVLANIEDGDRGVVREISRVGSPARDPLAQVGDLRIQTMPGSTRVTNCYAKWRHVPQKEQTYEERFLAWMVKPYNHDADLAVDGIMALLPDDTVDWENGPWPDTLEDALRFLVDHLTDRSS